MTTDKAQRKERPIARGVLDYFPDAIAEIAHVSFVGNQQHNPGQEMHWAKDKSPDHADCILRHLIERGTMDTDGLRHSAKAAWRALAMLQIELDQPQPTPVETGIQEYVERVTINQVEFFRPSGEYRRQADYNMLTEMGCPPKVAAQIVGGTTYAETPPGERSRYVYIAGPMRGFEKFNFPAFDAARDAFLAKGFHVISPADMGREEAMGRDPKKEDSDMQVTYAIRDFWSLAFIRKMVSQPNTGEYQKTAPVANGICLLPGWPNSSGATSEFFTGRWFNLTIYKPDATEYTADAAKHDFALAHSVMKIVTPKVNPLVFYDGDWDRNDDTRGTGWFYRIRGQDSFTVNYATGEERPGIDYAQIVSDINGGKFKRLNDDDAYVAHRKTR